MSKELKPCPFCGKEPKFSYWKHNGTMLYIIKCNNREHPVPVVRYPVGCDVDEVIAEWNNEEKKVRIIDADKLIEKFRDFKEWENDDGRPIHTMSEIQRIDRCINFAQMEPVAYDVDRVIEQLKAEESRYKAQALATDDTTDIMRCCMGESAMQTAIEIVKNGGMVSEAENLDVRR